MMRRWERVLGDGDYGRGRSRDRNRGRGRARSGRGFTLVEMVIAISLLVLMSAAAMSFSISATNTVLDYTHRSQAQTIAAAELTGMRESIESQRAADGSIDSTKLTAVRGTSARISALATCYKGGSCSTANATSLAVKPVTASTIITTGAATGTDPVSTTTYAANGYRVTTLVGTCNIPSQTSGTTTCDAGAITGKVGMIRPVVIVSWDDGECHYGADCTVARSTIVSASAAD